MRWMRWTRTCFWFCRFGERILSNLASRVDIAGGLSGLGFWRGGEKIVGREERTRPGNCAGE